MSEILNYSAGDIIFRQGYPGDHAYIVKKGEVEIYNELPDGSIESIAILHEGQMFGEMALTDDAPRSASARAHTDVSLQIMDI